MRMLDAPVPLALQQQVDPADVVMLVVAWHFGAATMCEFGRDEFVRGMAALRCDTPEKLRRRLPELRRELQDERKFKVSARVVPCCMFWPRFPDGVRESLRPLPTSRTVVMLSIAWHHEP